MGPLGFVSQAIMMVATSPVVAATAPKASATGEKVNFGLTDAEKLQTVVVGLVLLLFFIVVGWIVWRLFSKNRGLGGGTDADFSILDSLTADEARMVRDAMVRQTLQRENAGRQSGTTLAELERIAAMGGSVDAASAMAGLPVPQNPVVKPVVLKPAAPPASVQAPETVGMPKVALPAAPPWEQEDLSGEATLILDSNRSGERREAVPPVVKKADVPRASGGTIDLETLYQKGLIAREEYERLRALAEQAKSE
jgi:hypothetical protein